MKILAFLQNQYFNEPKRAQEIFNRNPDHREELIRRFLFAGCFTGRRLWYSLGRDLCQEIVWEEISREIGGHSGSSFPADMEHIHSVIRKHEPQILVGFGNLAGDALCQWRVDKLESGFNDVLPHILFAPHPAARQPEVTEQLIELGLDLEYRKREIFGIVENRHSSYAGKEDGRRYQ